MAAASATERRARQETAKVTTRKSSKAAVTNQQEEEEDALATKSAQQQQQQQLTEEHLPPLSLVLTVLLCSGFILMFALRDVLSTGRTIMGAWDDDMLLWTKSTQWFDVDNNNNNNNAGGKGNSLWKTKAGGFSAVMPVSTDHNNMGGFFVRKMAGAAACIVCLQKLVPLLVHPTGAQWILRDFSPLLWTAVVCNVAIFAFYSVYYKEFVNASVEKLPLMQMVCLVVESIVIFYHLVTQKAAVTTQKKPPAVVMTDGKTPNSPPSRIVARTVLLVSTAICVIAGRDLFFPGRILSFIRRDDIYLEWTNAFLHSPPPNSPEAMGHQGMESPLYIGDLYMSQYMALHLMLGCVFKFVTCLFIRHGSTGRGQIAARMIWQVQALGNLFLLFIMRLFANAAGSASLDLRWHLMALAYETFILGLYGFF